jgi:sigma-B regulation protein RsbU (phosphoserine phosphatase)
VNSARLAQLVRLESYYIAISAIVCAVLWAAGQRVNPLAVLVYTLCIGNSLTLLTESFEFLYVRHRFPYDLLIYLPILLVLTVPVYIIASTAVWLIVRPGDSLRELITVEWKFPVVATFVFGNFTFVYNRTKDRLERRNVELEQTVERRTASLAIQEQELERAREIQSSLLPKEIPQLAGFEVAAAWQPARTVSGDYYDVLRLADRRLGICIADVAGKGVSAALLMANVQAAVRAFASDAESPADVCRKVNALLHENVATGKFVTFLYGILDAQQRTFRFCNAGHLNPIHISRGVVTMLGGGGAVLGVFASWPYTDSVVQLASGDRLLLFTDGITEAADASGQEFEESGIANFAKANTGLSAKELNSRLLAQVTAFCNAQFHDDATVLVIAAS